MRQARSIRLRCHERAGHDRSSFSSLDSIEIGDSSDAGDAFSSDAQRCCTAYERHGRQPSASSAAAREARARAAALTGLAATLASGDLSLDPGAERDRAEAQLLALPGIGPWTAAYIRIRALSDPDAFLPSDVGVRDALGGLGAREAAALAESWRPWRSYAVHHLWAYLEEKGQS